MGIPWKKGVIEFINLGFKIKVLPKEGLLSKGSLVGISTQIAANVMSSET